MKNTITLEASELPYDGITLFSDRAEIHQHIELELGPGEHEIVVHNFSDPSINFHSLSVHAPGQEHVMLSTVVHETKEELSKDQKELIDKIKGEIQSLEKSIAKHNAALDRAEAQLGVIKSYGDSMTDYNRNSLPTVEALAQYVDFYASKASELDEARLQEKNAIRVLKEYLESNQIALTKATGYNNNYVHNVVISLLHRVESTTKVTLSLRYVTMAATWTPSYRIDVNSNTKKGELHFYANVRQWSGIDWSDVKLRLSTADASLSVVPPRMSPLYVGLDSRNDYNYAKPQPLNRGYSNTASVYTAGVQNIVNLEFSKIQNGAFDGVNQIEEEEEELLVDELEGLFEDKEETSISSSSVSSVYSFARPVVVRTQVETQLHVTTLELDELNFKHHAIPRLSTAVYLKATTRNTSPYTLIPGRVNVFMDGNFITTQSRLDKVINPQQQFDVFLGTDSGVHVEYKPMKKYQQTEGLLTSSTVDVVDTISYITNGKQTPINITIYDQVPISTAESIKVELINPTDAELKKTQSKINVEIHPQLKYIRWSGIMEPSEVAALPVKYKISYPLKSSIRESHQ